MSRQSTAGSQPGPARGDASTPRRHRPAAIVVAAGTAALLCFGAATAASATPAPTPIATPPAAGPATPVPATPPAAPAPAPAPSWTPAPAAIPAPKSPAPGTVPAPGPATPTPAAPPASGPADVPTGAPAESGTDAESGAKFAENRPPVPANDSFSVVSGHTVTIPWAFVLGNDTDPDDEGVVPRSIKEPLHGTADYAGLKASGAITYTSTSGFTGTEVLAYSIADARGLASAMKATITITVTPNSAPVTAQDTYSVMSGAPLVVKAPGVLTNDIDAQGDAKTMTISAAPMHGTVTATTGGKGGFTYTSTPGFLGKDVFFYRASDGFGGLSPITPVLVDVTKASFTQASAPVLKGSVKVGQNVIASFGSWLPTPTTWAYQWKRDGIAIPGATLNNLTLKPSDLGHVITVSGTGGTASIAPFTTTSAPATVMPGTIIVGKPWVTGVAVSGETLLAHANWSPNPVTLSYQWTRNGVPVPGATTSTYLLTNADGGFEIGVTVTGKKTGYTTVVSSSWTTTPIRKLFTSAPNPKITGTLKVGKVVTATTGTWIPAPTSFSYEWRRDNYPIAGATAKTYTIKAADAGHALSVFVTPVKSGYNQPALDSDDVYPTK